MDEFHLLQTFSYTPEPRSQTLAEGALHRLLLKQENN